MGEGSKYSDQLKVAALAQYDIDGRIRTVARQFNIPPSTLTDWIQKRKDGELDVVDAEQRIEHNKKVLIDKSVTIMGKALEVVEAKINACSAPQAATVYGILHDKVQAMQGALQQTGSVTNNIMINGVGEEEASRIMTKVLSRMRGRDINEDDDQE